ncbi:MAG: hypothetical protein QOD72_1486 [Acidimicrobiaceae bacterium]|jgi:hypothetical protein|nr:hypothetical protein [Acidimicrobiaceae bacterium]
MESTIVSGNRAHRGRYTFLAHSMGATVAWIVAPELAGQLSGLVV